MRMCVLPIRGGPVNMKMNLFLPARRSVFPVRQKRVSIRATRIRQHLFPGPGIFFDSSLDNPVDSVI